MAERDLCTAPLRLEPMRVRRTYRGGNGLDLWHGEAAPKESSRPEKWLASMTAAVNPGSPAVENEGLSAAVINGKRVLLRDLVAQNPEGMLGRDHVARYGSQMGVLAKIIDSAERLTIQVHPDKAFARDYFHSEYGKTECWHILSTRTADGQPPCLLMGFRPGVTRAVWESIYRRQDIPAMLDCLHRVTPRPGDTWLIRGGLPHAIGPGCTLVEIQEPTDYTLRSERAQMDGTPIPDALIHQGLGEEVLMERFTLRGPLTAIRCHPPGAVPQRPNRVKEGRASQKTGDEKDGNPPAAAVKAVAGELSRTAQTTLAIFRTLRYNGPWFLSRRGACFPGGKSIPARSLP